MATFGNPMATFGNPSATFGNPNDFLKNLLLIFKVCNTPHVPNRFSFQEKDPTATFGNPSATFWQS